MSIVTKKGDGGQTSLMFNRAASKCHARIGACGDLDELNAVLGLARATNPQDQLLNNLLAGIQADLIGLMGEVGTDREDLKRYADAGYRRVGPERLRAVEHVIAELEGTLPPMQGWAMPGSNMASATLDLARTVCRRAERSVCALAENKEITNETILMFLNRLSDLLWLLGRRAELGSAGSVPGTKV